MTFTDTQRRTRGHAFLPPKAEQRKVPAIGATTNVALDDKIVGAHYFVGGWDWYVVEADWATGEAWGMVKVSGSQPEWGYFSLAELEGLKPRAKAAGQTLTLSWVVERDCWWVSVKAGTL